MPTLTANDRCDVRDCGAQAYVSVDFPALQSNLLFCAHHFAAYEPALKALITAIVIHDERWTLFTNETPQNRHKGDNHA